ncbi:mCG140549, isoform CRA_b, partial [Mus musculus]
QRLNRSYRSVVPQPIACAARTLAEKSLHYFLESYLYGDTSDANIYPVPGCVAVVMGWGEPGDRIRSFLSTDSL